MAAVSFDVVRRFDAPPRRVWDELVDWPGHGAWIPATTIAGGDGDPTEVGYTFTAWSGVRPLVLEDRMRVTECTWDEERRVGVCAVDKLGPVLGGSAGFTVGAHRDGSLVVWSEDVTIPWLPSLLAPVAAVIGRVGFSLALAALARHLRRP
jgi:hypothetical protein